MEDLKHHPVRYLRELARKHLGRGHSKLKTKQALFEALKSKVPALFRSHRDDTNSSFPPAATAPVTSPESVSSRPMPPGAPSPGPVSEGVRRHSPPLAPLTGLAPEDTNGLSRTAVLAANLESRRATASLPVSPQVAQHVAEPLVQGFFVARVAGEQEARRHHLTEEEQKPDFRPRRPEVYDEHLGELPDRYGDDVALLLPRDPSTVVFFWDFRSDTQAQALGDLQGTRAVVRIFSGNELVREEDFALESRCFYVHGLPPGRSYRAEAHLVGSDGRSHRVGRSTHSTQVPVAKPSSDATVRFLRIPWELPLPLLRQQLKDGRARIEARPDSSRYLEVSPFAAPGSVPGTLRGWASSPSGRPS